ncbi:glycosyltransferase, partial [Lacticaseibacillus rhamnosus]
HNTKDLDVVMEFIKRVNAGDVASLAELMTDATTSSRMLSANVSSAATKWLRAGANILKWSPTTKFAPTNFSSVSLRPDSFAEFHRTRHQFATSFSDVELPNDSFASGERPAINGRRLMRAVFVGTLESLYKGPDTLVEAVDHCKRNGVEIELVEIGSGKYQAILQRKCERLGIQRQVRFTGALPAGDPVRKEL